MCKRYCKDVHVFTFEHIKLSMIHCLQNKLKRGDTRNYLLGKQVHNPQKRQEYDEKITTDHYYFNELIDRRARELLQELKSGELKLAPIRYEVRYDNNSHKNRNIAIQSIKQQICDYIALHGIAPFFKYIGKYQVAGIPGRGTRYGIQAMRKWLSKSDNIYAGKCDICKCYESIDHDKLIVFLQKHIKNSEVLWLVKQLINTYDKGLSIGSLLSQYLCTLYLAQLYHKIMEDMYVYESGKRINLVKHTLFQMDDILILCGNREYAEKAMQNIEKELDKMGLCLKKNYEVYKVKMGGNKSNNSGRFIDIMGYRFYCYNTKVTLRRNTYKRLRRCALRTINDFKMKRGICAERARRNISLLGRLIETDYFILRKAFASCFYRCKGVISKYEKSKIRCTARAC